MTDKICNYGLPEIIKSVPRKQRIILVTLDQQLNKSLSDDICQWEKFQRLILVNDSSTNVLDVNETVIDMYMHSMKKNVLVVHKDKQQIGL